MLDKQELSLRARIAELERAVTLAEEETATGLAVQLAEAEHKIAQLEGTHRCPHFQPKGEDSGGAYNNVIIKEVTDDLLTPWERSRLSGTRWYQLTIKNLIQRIANLRIMLAEAKAASRPSGDEEAAARDDLATSASEF
jgi:hypothetical protein